MQVRALTQDGKDLSLNSDLLSLKEYAQALPLSKVAFIPEGKLSQNSRETLSLYLTKKNSAMSAALATITHGNIGKLLKEFYKENNFSFLLKL